MIRAAAPQTDDVLPISETEFVGIVASPSIEGVIGCAAIKGVVADAPGELVGAVQTIKRVVALITIQNIVCGVAGDLIVPAVAIGIEDARHQHKIFNVVRELVVVDGRIDRVSPLSGLFDHRIIGVLNIIEVIPPAAAHGVCAGKSVNDIVAIVAGDIIPLRTARGVYIGGSHQDKFLDIRLIEGEADG